MFSVTVSNNLQRKTVSARGEDTLRDIFERADVGAATGHAQINGKYLSDEQLDRPLSDFNPYDDRVNLLSAVKKMDNA